MFPTPLCILYLLDLIRLSTVLASAAAFSCFLRNSGSWSCLYSVSSSLTSSRYLLTFFDRCSSLQLAFSIISFSFFSLSESSIFVFFCFSGDFLPLGCAGNVLIRFCIWDANDVFLGDELRDVLRFLSGDLSFRLRGDVLLDLFLLLLGGGVLGDRLALLFFGGVLGDLASLRLVGGEPGDLAPFLGGEPRGELGDLRLLLGGELFDRLLFPRRLGDFPDDTGYLPLDGGGPGGVLGDLRRL